jgi:hypothetical protein
MKSPPRYLGGDDTDPTTIASKHLDHPNDRRGGRMIHDRIGAVAVAAGPMM